MSRRDVLQVCTLSAHLAKQETCSCCNVCDDIRSTNANQCAADALRLQKLGARARRNARKNWLDPGLRDTVPGYEVQTYLDECGRIGGEVARVLSPYGIQQRDFAVGLEGVTILSLPGDHVGLFGKGFLI